MNRLRLYDVRTSRFPSVMGVCTADVAAIADRVNSVQRRLIYAKEGRDEGWWGTWAEVVFNVSREQPYITLPREIARLEAIDVCSFPVPLRNQFYEYQTFGNGRMPKESRWATCRSYIREGFTRNNAITSIEMTNAPQFITAYPTSAEDIGKRILIQGLDVDGNIIYSQDGPNQVVGTFLTFSPPNSSTTAMTLTQINGIQKDVTVGPVRIYQHDPASGEEVLLLTMEPGEQTASYRRYYLNGLPCNCCQSPDSGNQVQVTALAKLEIIPVVTDTDYLLIQNLEAVIEEGQSLRYSEMDDPSAKQMAQERHIQAIRLLNGELNHYIGKDQVAVNFKPFGSSPLRKYKIGSLQ